MKILTGMAFVLSTLAFANQPAFQIGKNTFTLDDVAKEDQMGFFQVEKQRFDFVERVAQQKFLEEYWEKEAKRTRKTPDQAREAYLNKNASVSATDVRKLLEQHKDNEQLKAMSKADAEKQVRDYLREQKRGQAMAQLIENAKKKGEYKVLMPQPVEPVLDVAVDEKNEMIRYNATAEFTKAQGCTSDCPITVVEYSEFECPFCGKVLPTAEKLLNDYKGKVRWIVRDFPLNFHPRAVPAATAAYCAAEQNKEFYWNMYFDLFTVQRQLTDENFDKFAAKIKGLDQAAWKKCYQNPPQAIKDRITKNEASGRKLGVSGTPAFFINGKQKSGALPYAHFKEAFDEALKAKKS
jgi:protein-disulfide isomerase